MTLTALCWSNLERFRYGEHLILIFYIRKWRQSLQNLGRFGLLSVDDLPLEISATDVNVCFNTNYLSLENDVVDIMVEDLFSSHSFKHFCESQWLFNAHMWLDSCNYII